ncbi:hypothetical protein FocTR4_00012922 [Fusarium oxysporum f. sp. cubense]|uniref:Uncharacterized protein n=1 Tax=Fusarium oxysporum f. sp. cubense TaxID=61366 RepID=A0A5C6SII1_FUSOC|nr:hypothetical protein FocTR4_00012922 [Fusarium oxysporum f. sp. cubense]
MLRYLLFQCTCAEQHMYYAMLPCNPFQAVFLGTNRGFREWAILAPEVIPIRPGAVRSSRRSYNLTSQSH